MADQGQNSDQRPSPEALLAEARREEKGSVGRLKIFVGAAPGLARWWSRGGLRLSGENARRTHDYPQRGVSPLPRVR